MFKRTLAFLLTIGLALAVSTASADVPISGLPAATSVSGADTVPIVQSGTTKKATIAQWFAYTPAFSAGFSVAANANASFGSAYIFGDANTLTLHAGSASGSVLINNAANSANNARFPDGGGFELDRGAISIPYNGIINAPTNGMTVGVDASGYGTLRIYNANGAQFQNSDGTGYAPVRGGVYTNASDRRWKKDIRPVGYGLAAAMVLKPSAFTWKATGKRDLGFIAQDVQKVLPELVTADKRGYLGMNYSGVIPVLTRAIQEQQAEIEKLKGELHATAPRTSFLGRLRWLFAGA